MREITALMVVKLVFVLHLEVLTILTKKMASSPPPFLNTSNLACPQALAEKVPHARVPTNSKSENAVSGCFSVSFCQFCAP